MPTGWHCRRAGRGADQQARGDQDRCDRGDEAAANPMTHAVAVNTMITTPMLADELTRSSRCELALHPARDEVGRR